MPELSLDFRPGHYVPKTISDVIKEVSLITDVSDKILKLDGFVNGLEEELRKIDAFKRELPLCMFLLNDAILFMKSESMQSAASNNQPVLEEFIPLKKASDPDGDNGDGDDQNGLIKDSKEKKNWMSSVQLWNTNDHHPSTHNISETKQKSLLESKPTKKSNHQYANDDKFPAYKSKRSSKGFLPFETFSGLSRKETNNNGQELPVSGLALLTPRIKKSRRELSSTDSRASCSRAASSSASNPQSNLQNGSQSSQPQTARKQRRCWSPELHRRFVDALQQLGGSRAATPKQIRELMQVDGLTNDEVKSHLQKYRLHTRKLPPSGTTASADQSVVVLGESLWVCREQWGADPKATGSPSGSPQGPLQLAGSTGGDSMEEDEDAKSEDYSWKSHIHRSGKVYA